MQTGIIILSAGNSGRLGHPKQLLKIKGKTLIQVAVDAALATGFSPLLVVLGTYAAEISVFLPKSIITIINESWVDGISSSIAVGLSSLLENSPALDNVIISVSDQPHISSLVFVALVDKSKETGKGIIASSYENINGTPALFDKKYFTALCSLKGDSGSKPILKSNPEDLESIEFPKGKIDIDYDQDYKTLTKNQ